MTHHQAVVSEAGDLDISLSDRPPIQNPNSKIQNNVAIALQF
ncbi:MAG: hypothetical protein ACFE0I_03550 [Elainellaceae cyanobacterium]